MVVINFLLPVHMHIKLVVGLQYLAYVGSKQVKKR